LFRVTAAVNVLVVLMGTLLDVELIETAVTRTLPLPPPPHEEIPTNPTIESTEANHLEYRFLITGLPFDRSARHRTPQLPFAFVSERSPESRA
jgi:hypothetical protein